MNLIKKGLLKEIEECNSKETKDIIIIIDFNTYSNQEQNNNNSEKIDSFIEQTIIILDNYLSRNDRLGVFIHKNQYQIICPLQTKYNIDLDNFSKDLINNKKRIFNEIKEDEEINSNDNDENNLEKDKLEINFGIQKFSRAESQDSFQSEDGQIKINDNIVKSLVDTINYSQKYLKIKEGLQHEKYIILFTDIFNVYKMNDQQIISNLNKINEEKDITFLLVGKNMDKTNEKKFDLEEKLNKSKILLDKFGERSETIEFENMKKIKNILSKNTIIKDEFIFPNEIYK